MVDFKLTPFTLPLANVHTLKIKITGSFEEIEKFNEQGEKIESEFLLPIYYELWRTTEEGIEKCIENGNKRVPAELNNLLLRKLTNTLINEEKAIINQFLKSFNPDINVIFE